MRVAHLPQNAHTLERHFQSAETWLFYGLLLVLLLPIWIYPIFPVHDGLIHLQTAKIIIDLLTKKCAIMQDFFSLHLHIAPNWTGHLIMVALLFLGVAPLVTEKLLISVCVLGVPYAVRYAIGRIHPNNRWMSLFAIPFAYNLILLGGSFNMALGLILCFMIFGWWLPKSSPSLKEGILLALLLLFTYFSHLMALAALLLLLSCLAIGHFCDTHADVNTRLQRFFRSQAILAAAALPAMLLTGYYLFQSAMDNDPKPLPELAPLGERLGYFFSFHMLAPSQQGNMLLNMAVLSYGGIVLFYMIYRMETALKICRFDKEGGRLFIGLLLLFALMLFIPEEMGGGWIIYKRLSVFVWLTAILWFAAQHYAFWIKTVTVLLLAFLSLLIVFAWHDSIRKDNEKMAQNQPPLTLFQDNSSLLTVSLARDGQRLGAVVALDKCVAKLSNYTAYFPFFPVIFNAESQFGKRWSNLLFLGNSIRSEKEDLSALSLAAYMRKTGRTIDQVMIWGKPTTLKANEKHIYAQLEQELNRYYRQIFRSKDEQVTLYALRKEEMLSLKREK